MEEAALVVAPFRIGVGRGGSLSESATGTGNLGRSKWRNLDKLLELQKLIDSGLIKIRICRRNHDHLRTSDRGKNA